MTAKQARRLAVRRQLLDRARLPEGKEGAARAVEHLGYVQIDTISVVQRAHHHTLWNRVPGYDPAHLDELQSKDRRVFEYWGHAASFLPMTDYRFYKPMMTDYVRFDPVSEKYDPDDRKSNWIHTNKRLLDMVINRIAKQGPLAAADFPDVREGKRDSWWDWKPAKTALEVQFWMGNLMVTERRKFQRVYDLTERVLPKGTDTRTPDAAEVARFAVRRALNAHGVASRNEIQGHLSIGRMVDIDSALAELVGAREVVEIRAAGARDGELYALAESLSAPAGRARAALHLLSPFDNLIIQRPRTERVFGFSYQMECYKPAAKRIHGYFVLPILWGADLIGRLDAKADRKTKELIIHTLLFENEFTEHDAVLEPLASRLKEFATFNGVDRVRLTSVTPAKLKRPLTKLLAT